LIDGLIDIKFSCKANSQAGNSHWWGWRVSFHSSYVCDQGFPLPRR